jgi:hypothetical protein
LVDFKSEGACASCARAFASGFAKIRMICACF